MGLVCRPYLLTSVSYHGDARARVACGDMMYSCSSQCMRGAIVF